MCRDVPRAGEYCTVRCKGNNNLPYLYVTLGTVDTYIRGIIARGDDDNEGFFLFVIAVIDQLSINMQACHATE